MKKQLLLLVFMLLPLMANAQKAVEIDGIYYYVSWSSKIAEVKQSPDQDKYSGDIVIPSSITYDGDDYVVTSIKYQAFYECYNLTSITIPNTVTSIGSEAFRNCWNLTSITIPASVEEIGIQAFENSGVKKVVLNSNAIVSKDYGNIQVGTSLESIFGGQVEEYILGEEVTRIGRMAFESCYNLTTINIPNSVTSIGTNAFLWSNLNSVHISDMESWYKIQFENAESNPVYIANHLYVNGEEIKDLEIPNSVTSIGNYTFAGFKAPTSIIIPNSVTSIGEGAFLDCTGLSSITIPNNVTSICKETFKKCSNLTSIIIPNSVTKIEENAFVACTGLTSINLPNSLIIIGNGAFYGCENITSVTLGNSVTSIGKEAFSGCTKITSIDIPNSMTTIGEGAFAGCGITSVIIPNSVTSIEEEAFAYCWYLSSVDIPNSVTTIGKKAFNSCGKLSSVKIGNGVTSIGEKAFEDCTNLKSVHITDLEAWCRILFSDSQSNPTKWARYLYLNDEEIKDLVIPETITSINDYAFNGCSKLTSVTIPNSVTSIGTYALSFYDDFTDLYCYAEQVPSTKKYAFSNSICEYATLHVPANSIEAYKNAEQWRNFGNIVALTDPSGIESTTATQQPTVVECYTIDGKRINQPQRGLNIVKMSDGTTRKVVVK